MSPNARAVLRFGEMTGNGNSCDVGNDNVLSEGKKYHTKPLKTQTGSMGTDWVVKKIFENVVLSFFSNFGSIFMSLIF